MNFTKEYAEGITCVEKRDDERKFIKRLPASHHLNAKLQLEVVKGNSMKGIGQLHRGTEQAHW
jgi:hypothetical protein